MFKFQFIAFVVLFFGVVSFSAIVSSQRQRNNGDIYIISERDIKSTNPFTSEEQESAATSSTPDENVIDFDAVMDQCNNSFYISKENLQQFNTTGELLDVVDKTGMCFIRCLYEKSGLIENWTLNADKIRRNIWPATGDTIDFCQQEGKNETNACVHLYSIAKCLTIRSIVDARNQPMV